MQKFDGFPQGSKLSPTAFPSQFFSELLPMIDDLAELKLTLFCFWALHQKEGRFRYLRRSEFNTDSSLLDGLRAAAPRIDPQQTLESALTRAIERGTLLCESVDVDGKDERLYFVNTALGRTAVEQLQSGQWYPGESEKAVEILPERPNIYRLYEVNIGSLTPMISDALKEAEKDYPAEWIEQAIREATELNKHSWRYIASILKRWEKEGRGRDYVARTTTDGDVGDFIIGRIADPIDGG